ncbi:hypothetical protein [Pseudoalteromonas sp.]|uniref:hypothetical protein n=1 Tax=Pseudoalteromonas sp. TaxID=53249 RepID=UPI0026280EF5|nr:hypothetical protein [Pseudoalteromonas sp.]MCP4585375.1 hypothetical protein [Pseudoalteromonas sp.]
MNLALQPQLQQKKESVLDALIRIGSIAPAKSILYTKKIQTILPIIEYDLNWRINGAQAVFKPSGKLWRYNKIAFEDDLTPLFNRKKYLDLLDRFGTFTELFTFSNKKQYVISGQKIGGFYYLKVFPPERDKYIKMVATSGFRDTPGPELQMSETAQRFMGWSQLELQQDITLKDFGGVIERKKIMGKIKAKKTPTFKFRKKSGTIHNGVYEQIVKDDKTFAFIAKIDSTPLISTSFYAYWNGWKFVLFDCSGSLAAMSGYSILELYNGALDLCFGGSIRTDTVGILSNERYTAEPVMICKDGRRLKGHGETQKITDKLYKFTFLPPPPPAK